MSRFLLTFLIIFTFNIGFASQQVLTCGWTFDLTQTNSKDFCGMDSVDECGILIDDNVVLYPWMELWLTADGSYPSLTLLKEYAGFDNFIVDFWGLSSLTSEMLSFEMVEGKLNFNFSSVVGNDSWLTKKGEVINFDIKTELSSTIVKKAAFFKGKISANSQEEDAEAFGCLYQ